MRVQRGEKQLAEYLGILPFRKGIFAEFLTSIK